MADAELKQLYAEAFELVVELDRPDLLRRLIDDLAALAGPPPLALRRAPAPIVCAECHGEGRITVGGYSVNPSSGVLVNDPQMAHDERCPACGGSGVVSA